MLDPVTQLQHQPIRTLSSIVHELALTLLQLLTLSLLLLGIGGIVFKALGTDGWLPSALAVAWDQGPGYLVAAVVALLLGSTWLSRTLTRRSDTTSHSADALVYACLALGVFFATRLYITGTL